MTRCQKHAWHAEPQEDPCPVCVQDALHAELNHRVEQVKSLQSKLSSHLTCARCGTSWRSEHEVSKYDCPHCGIIDTMNQYKTIQTAFIEQGNRLEEAAKQQALFDKLWRETCDHENDLKHDLEIYVERAKAAEGRLDQALNDGEELRAKGRAAWEVLERYLADAHNIDANKLPGSDDLLIALTGLRFLPPTDDDMEWAKNTAALVEKLGTFEEVVGDPEKKTGLFKPLPSE